MIGHYNPVILCVDWSYYTPRKTHCCWIIHDNYFPNKPSDIETLRQILWKQMLLVLGDLPVRSKGKTHELHRMGVSKNGGTPKRMVYNGNSHKNWWFRGTTINGNSHMTMHTGIQTIHTIPYFVVKPYHFHECSPRLDGAGLISLHLWTSESAPRRVLLQRPYHPNVTGTEAFLAAPCRVHRLSGWVGCLHRYDIYI